jgi:hypothetical protein
MKKFTPITFLLYAGIGFLLVSFLAIVFGFDDHDSNVIGTIYVVGAIICSTIVRYSIPVSITNHIKPEVIDLLEWSHRNIPESDHPDLCAEFVKEFRKRFTAAQVAGNEEVNTV